MGLFDISNFIQPAHETIHSNVNTPDFIISHGLDVEALNVTSVSSAVLTTLSLHLAIIVKLSEKLPGVLVHLR